MKRKKVNCYGDCNGMRCNRNWELAIVCHRYGRCHTTILRVGGPEGFIDEVRAEGGHVDWFIPGGIPDGTYRYDVYVITGEEEASDRIRESYRESGRFEVRHGVPVTGDDIEREGRLGIGILFELNRAFTRAVDIIVDALVSPAHAADLTASSLGNPRVLFDETDGGTGADWIIGADGESTSNASCGGGTFSFAIFDDVDNNCRKVFELQDGSSSTSTFIQQSDGDISLANDAVFIDRSADRVGIGTVLPGEAVDVVQNGGARFQLSSFSSVATDAAQYIQRRARGTQAAPASVQSGDNIGLFSFRGMRPNGLFSGSKAAITVQANINGNHADTNDRS